MWRRACREIRCFLRPRALRRRCRADAGSAAPVIAQVVNGFSRRRRRKQTSPIETGRRVRLVLLNGGYCSDPRPRGSARWAHARRDRSVTAARAQRKCRRRAQSSSVATQHRPRDHLDPVFAGQMRRWRLPFTPPNAAANRQPIRQCAGVPATKQPEKRVSASFRRSRSSGARTGWCGLPIARSQARGSMVAAACMRATSMAVWCSASPRAGRVRRSARHPNRTVSPAAILDAVVDLPAAADPAWRGCCLRPRPPLSLERGSNPRCSWKRCARLGHGSSALRTDAVSSCGPGRTPLVATSGGRVGSHQPRPVVVVLSARLALLVDALPRE